MTGAVAAYSFSETQRCGGAGCVAATANDAALVNTPARALGDSAAGSSSMALGDAMVLPSTENLAFSNAFTVEAWIAPASFGL